MTTKYLHRKRLKLFQEQEGKCFHCHGEMVLSDYTTGRQDRDNAPDDAKPRMATFEHLDDRWSPERGKHPGERRIVLACWKCNNQKNEERLKTIPVEIHRARTKYARSNVFRNNKVHVLSEQCKTCIFRPGNVFHLEPGRLKKMVDDATQANTLIICHSTLDQKDQAGCRGFFDNHPTQALKLAQAFDMIQFVPEPIHEESKGPSQT